MAFYLIFNFLLLGAAGFFFYRYTRQPEIRAYFLPTLIFRMMAGAGVGLIYWYYYQSGDTIRFHELSVKAYHLGKENFTEYLGFLSGGKAVLIMEGETGLSQEPRTLFFVRGLSLLCFLTGGNYWLNGCYLSFLSFTGSWLIIRQTVRISRENRYPALIAFGFFPATVFWSSGVLKESLAMCCLGILAWIFLEFFFEHKIKWNYLPVLLLTAWVYWEIRYYAFIILAIVMTTVILTDLITSLKRNSPTGIIFAVTFLLLTLTGSLIHPNFRLDGLIALLRSNHDFIISISPDGNTVPFIPAGNNVLHFIINIPVSLLAGLFMPLPFQGNNLLALAAGILNFLVLCASIFLLYGKLRWPPGRTGILFAGMCLYVAVLAVLIAYSTPNFGTLERYKVSYYPVFVFLIFSGICQWRRATVSGRRISS
jgi:hypothetical protein